jgi:LIVCS family branched-chain amino acid:cation transporter
VTTIFTIIPAFFAGLESLPKSMQNEQIIRQILSWNNYLPLSELGLGWVVFALIGLASGWLISKLIKD